MSETGAKKYWLVKSEPDVYPLSQLKCDGWTGWTGVRNYQARNYMRDGMKIGDGVLFYHSNAEPKAIMGLARVCKEAHPDPEQFDPNNSHYDPKSKPENPTWMMAGIEFVQEFDKPLSLDELRKIPALKNMVLLQKGSRLSVQPVTPAEYAAVLKAAGI